MRTSTQRCRVASWSSAGRSAWPRTNDGVHSTSRPTNGAAAKPHSSTSASTRSASLLTHASAPATSNSSVCAAAPAAGRPTSAPAPARKGAAVAGRAGDDSCAPRRTSRPPPCTCAARSGAYTPISERSCMRDTARSPGSSEHGAHQRRRDGATATPPTRSRRARACSSAGGSEVARRALPHYLRGARRRLSAARRRKESMRFPACSRNMTATEPSCCAAPRRARPGHAGAAAPDGWPAGRAAARRS